MSQITSREFNQHPSKAKREASAAPVFITDRGRPSHVLMSYEAYQSLTSEQAGIAEALAMPGLAEIDFQPEKATINAGPVDLT